MGFYKHCPTLLVLVTMTETLSADEGMDTTDVLHVVGDNDELVRFRISSTDQIVVEKTLAGFNLETIRTVRSRLADTQLGCKLSEAQGRAKRRLRKAVTGNPDKKVRDYMKEVPQVKLVDKLSFTCGVTCIVLTEFLALRYPQYFTSFYLVLMTGLLTNRYMEYRAENYHLFMLDFCYFMNVSVLMQTILFPDCLVWFKANYALCMGVLMMAILVWQNSLVFHSLDKLTSIFIHVFPPLTLHLYRWGLIPSTSIHTEDVLSLTDLMTVPLLMYLLWQAGFLLATELLLADKLRADPTLVTSVRYLAQDKKNGMHQLTKRVMRRLGVMAPQEDFDSEQLKSEVIFQIVQGVYSIAVCLPTMWLYSSYYLSVLYICFIYLWCIWRGATYYIEIFSERYKMKFVAIEKEESDDNHNDKSYSRENSDEQYEHTLDSE